MGGIEARRRDNVLFYIAHLIGIIYEAMRVSGFGGIGVGSSYGVGAVKVFPFG